MNIFEETKTSEKYNKLDHSHFVCIKENKDDGYGRGNLRQLECM